MTTKKKKPAVAAADENVISDIGLCTNNTTETAESQGFQAISSDYKQIVNDEEKSRHWLFIVYPESAPEDWTEQLEKTGIPFAVSPLHDMDINPDGTVKKEHYHVIVSYGNTTTYNSVKGLREITNGPFPLICRSVAGAYAYFSHKHNPEKYQYDEQDIRKYNGWAKVLEKSEVSVIMDELTQMVFAEDVKEYAELVIVSGLVSNDHKQVAMNHTMYFNALCRSYRHDPVRTLTRYKQTLSDEEEIREIEQRIEIEISRLEARAKNKKEVQR